MFEIFNLDWEWEFMVLVSSGPVRRPWLRSLIVLEPTDGNIYMVGKRIKDMIWHEHMLLVMFYRPLLCFPIPNGCRKYCSFRRWRAGLRYSRKQKALAKVGLPVAEYGNHLPSEQSGGEQQQVGIVRNASVGQPKILLLDDLFSLGCYFKNSCRFWRRIAKIWMTTIFVTHDTKLWN